MELRIWSIPFFFLSKKMAPLRLTIRSAFSLSSDTWSALVRLVKLGRLLAILNIKMNQVEGHRGDNLPCDSLDLKFVSLKCRTGADLER